MAQYIGFDIGGTKCAVCVAQADWQQNTCTIIGRIQIPTERQPWQQVLDALISGARTLMAQYGVSPVAAGVSCGGPLNSKTGIIMSPPNLPGWDNVPAANYIGARLGIPAYLQNDANACTVAEWKFGAGVGCTNLIFLTFGTGLGAGLILDGKLYEGTNGLAGEAGHIRLAEHGPTGYGKEGSFEGFCSGGGIARLARQMVHSVQNSAEAAHPAYASSPLLQATDSDITAKSVSIAAESGDALALAIYRISAEHLGQGLSLLIDLFNPERIIIGSVFARSERLFREPMEKIIRQEALPAAAAVCSIVPAALGDRIGDYAAVAAAHR